MQNSPQEIKSRLDRAVDPEGNVLDMAAVLELVTTLERLPITREALETTRIGKTINLLRKKTNNEVLAKRAKKLVKKWQKLVINQIEASRSVDSPINGSRISSPQINGTLCESDKSSTPTLTDRAVKSISINDYNKRGLKRKRSSSSSGNSPLTLVESSSQDRIRPITPTNITSHSKPPIPTTDSSRSEFIQSKESSPSTVHKKPKLTEDKDKLFDEKDRGTPSIHTSELTTTEVTNSRNLEDNSIEKDNIASDVPDGINIENSDSKEGWISGQASESSHNVNNSDKNLYIVGISNVNGRGCKKDTKNDVNTVPVKNQNHSTVKQQENNSCISHSKITEEKLLDQRKNVVNSEDCGSNANSQNVKIDESNNGLPCSKNQGPSECNVAEKKNSGTENCLSTKMSLNTADDLDQSHTLSELIKNSKNELQIEGTLLKMPHESESMADELLKPNELVLDMSEEANGINGRYSDDGTWYAWTDVMPYNDGSLNILPYVILD